MSLEVWFDSARDGIELQPERSFVGLSRHLATVSRRPYRDAPANIRALFDYQAPDCVISYRNSPVLSLEITDMNPSGHNIPQRFLCMLRAAELGVPRHYVLHETRPQTDFRWASKKYQPKISDGSSPFRRDL